MIKKDSAEKVRIEGNCDERGSDEYNLALGEKRAKAAMEYLVTLGDPGGTPYSDQLRQGKACRSRS
jgi:peptidoglycan-associated lipoprotein